MLIAIPSPLFVFVSFSLTATFFLVVSRAGTGERACQLGRIRSFTATGRGSITTSFWLVPAADATGADAARLSRTDRDLLDVRSKLRQRRSPSCRCGSRRGSLSSDAASMVGVGGN
jgi:hypothetical protein